MHACRYLCLTNTISWVSIKSNWHQILLRSGFPSVEASHDAQAANVPQPQCTITGGKLYPGESPHPKNMITNKGTPQKPLMLSLQLQFKLINSFHTAISGTNNFNFVCNSQSWISHHDLSNKSSKRCIQLLEGITKANTNFIAEEVPYSSCSIVQLEAGNPFLYQYHDI